MNAFRPRRIGIDLAAKRILIRCLIASASVCRRTDDIIGPPCVEQCFSATNYYIQLSAGEALMIKYVVTLIIGP